jgi:penicillin-binding protein 2
MSLVLSKKMELQGVNIGVVPKRLYCLGSLAPHVFGFLGEIDRSELQKDAYVDYSVGDIVGKYALEKWGEKYLRGKKGGQQTEVDVFGNRQKVLAEVEPVAGCNLVISIVPKIQRVAEALLKEKIGAVVVLDPRNGEVIALASSPGFDSNLFARGIDYKDWKKLINNPFHPLLNRAIQSQQPPASLFKVVTAVAALEEKVVGPDIKFHCPGYFKLGNRVFHCWRKNGHGWINMKNAIVQSCDIYFYNIALRVGIDNIVKYAKLFGFGKKTGIELEGEKRGLVPTPQWKKKRFGTRWQKGETLIVSIGQGFLLTTPIQIATAFSGIANGGMIPKPRIVLKVELDGSVKESFPEEHLKDFRISKDTHSFIKNALTGVVNDSMGTGYKAKIEGVLVAGKTGTAQVANKKNISGEAEDVPWHLRDHAWFVAFAPADKPEIVVSVLIEHGGSGGTVAAPIAKEIIRVYLNRDKNV